MILSSLRPNTDEMTTVIGLAKAGSMVFGGGHVVLPLLEAETVAKGVMSRDEFLAGYGFAQAVPDQCLALALMSAGLSAWAETHGWAAWNH